MTVFGLGNTIQLGGVRAGQSMRDARTLKITMQLMIFTPESD
jgi:hypothetical protein